ncbi:hypothetical protein [Pseudophaeobacter leonis]|uniref:hypothetical protein n=1 Tax=Pseudophaeobacter leonis TaxID=1144477 RepID=UPI0030C6679C
MDHAAEQRIEQLNGQPFYVRRWGDPALPHLLLLHGFPEYGGAWSELAERALSPFSLHRARSTRLWPKLGT